MKAAVVGSEGLRVAEIPRPRVPRNWALVAVRQAGVCGTDLALTRGLYGFQGVPGHEFVGTVERGPAQWRGARVVADINVPCGRCATCRRDDPRHCPARRVIGIRELPGAFAEYLAVPVRNLFRVPARLDDDAAVFTEPLAAALEACRQVPRGAAALVVGPGRLGLLTLRALLALGHPVSCVGRSAQSLARLPTGVEAADHLPASWRRRFDHVIECSGSAQGVALAFEAVRARGTLVLKSTSETAPRLDLARAVVDEVRLVGSRCGDTASALRWLAQGRIDPRDLITARHALACTPAALRDARSAQHVKVIVSP